MKSRRDGNHPWNNNRQQNRIRQGNKSYQRQSPMYLSRFATVMPRVHGQILPLSGRSSCAIIQDSAGRMDGSDRLPLTCTVGFRSPRDTGQARPGISDIWLPSTDPQPFYQRRQGCSGLHLRRVPLPHRKQARNTPMTSRTTMSAQFLALAI